MFNECIYLSASVEFSNVIFKYESKSLFKNLHFLLK